MPSTITKLLKSWKLGQSRCILWNQWFDKFIFISIENPFKKFELLYHLYRTAPKFYEKLCYKVYNCSCFLLPTLSPSKDILNIYDTRVLFSSTLIYVGILKHMHLFYLLHFRSFFSKEVFTKVFPQVKCDVITKLNKLDLKAKKYSQFPVR